MEPEPGDWIKISLHNFCSQSLCWCSLDVSCYINKQRRLAHMGVKKYSYRLLCSILFPDVQGLQTMRSCTVLISGHVTEFVRGRLLWSILFTAVQGPPNQALLYCSDPLSCVRHLSVNPLDMFELVGLNRCLYKYASLIHALLLQQLTCVIVSQAENMRGEDSATFTRQACHTERQLWQYVQ